MSEAEQEVVVPQVEADVEDSGVAEDPTVVPEPEPIEEEEPEPRPAADQSVDVALGDTVTVTLPREAAEVLAYPENRKLAEVGDAQILLREQL